MDDIRFTLYLVGYAKQLIQGYGAASIPYRVVATTTSETKNTITLTDIGYARVVFPTIYNEPYPGDNDPRVVSLLAAIQAWRDSSS